eukprot:1159371-Pelagomonas_calceolata.AAC.2
MLTSNSELVRKILKADKILSAAPDAKCWTVEILESFKGLEKHEQYTQVVLTGAAINIKDLATDWRNPLCREWRNLDNVEPKGHHHKRASYSSASHLSPLNANVYPYKVPRYLDLDLRRTVQCNVSRIRLLAHTLGVEKACWQPGRNGHCGFCDLHNFKILQVAKGNFTHLEGTIMHIFSLQPPHRQEFPMMLLVLYYSEVRNEDVFLVLRQGSNQLYYFIPDVMDAFCAAGRDQQAEQ